MSTSVVMQVGKLEGEWDLEAKEEQLRKSNHLLMFVTSAKTKSLLARYKDHLPPHESNF